MPVANLNDTQIYYREMGDGHPCLVMHGGMGFDHSAARPWIDPLGDTLRLVYYDHRGNGRSGRPALDTITYEQFAADAEALRQYLDYEKVAVMGISAGGAVALHHALAYPDSISHLILVSTHAAWDYGDEIAAHLEQVEASPEQLAVFSAELPETDAEYATMVKAIMPLFYYRFDRAANERFLKDVIWSASGYIRYGELLRTHDVASRLEEIQVPTLVIVGRHDFITPPTQAQRLKNSIPNAELEIFEQSGHMPYIEEADGFTLTVRDWLS